MSYCNRNTAFSQLAASVQKSKKQEKFDNYSKNCLKYDIFLIVLQRLLTENIHNSKKKQVAIFSIGLEIKIREEWQVIVRHCNYNTDSPEVFHTHCFNKEGKTRQRLPGKKTPGSLMKWAKEDLSKNFGEYVKQVIV